MEIPQNILKELEERKLKALLGNPTSATPDPSTSLGASAEEIIQGQALKTQESSRSDLGNSEPITPVMSMRGFIQQPSVEAPIKTRLTALTRPRIAGGV